MSTTSDACPNAGGTPSTATAPPATNVFTPILKNAGSNAQTITGASVNWVRSSVAHPSRFPHPLTTHVTGPTCPRKHIRRVACQNYLTGFCPLGPECSRGQYVPSHIFLPSLCTHRWNTVPHLCISPKPDIPPTKSYEAPEAPARDLGPPPPGYGRYADFGQERYAVTNVAGFGDAAGGAIRRNLDDVTCFKVGTTTRFPLSAEFIDWACLVWAKGTLCESMSQQECTGKPWWFGPCYCAEIWGRMSLFGCLVDVHCSVI